EELEALRARIRILYEGGVGSTRIDNDTDCDPPFSDEKGRDEQSVPNARVHIPPETLLESLALQLRVHPISMLWLLEEGRDNGGWISIPEERRFKEDALTMIVLRLLGHRWPKQIEADEPAWDGVDRDGITLISNGVAEKTLYERVRARIPQEFPD